MKTESDIKWHKNGNWGNYYRGWEAFKDHYLCNEKGHRFFGKKVIVICRGFGDFDIKEYEQKTNA